MGAFTSLWIFDVAQHRAAVAPALVQLVRGVGAAADTATRAALEREVATHRRSEAEFVEHYRTHRRLSEDLTALGAGLGVSVFAGPCELVREDLGVVDDDAVLDAVVPRIDGSCTSSMCPDRARCPLHPEGQHPCRAEMLMRFLQSVIEREHMTEEVVLGRHAYWLFFPQWYATLIGATDDDGYVDDEAFVVERLPTDRTLQLLLRLSKRGAAIGWGDGGFGEGLLGWLDETETRELATRLGALGSPPELDRDIERGLVAIGKVAARAAELQRGLILTRS